jgi:hypothetical protein
MANFIVGETLSRFIKCMIARPGLIYPIYLADAEKESEESELTSECYPTKELSFLRKKYFLLTGAF